jgi:hypothetical protein
VTADREILDNVLASVDRHAQTTRLAILGAAALEGLLLLFALWKLDWQNETHLILFILFVLTYTVIALGLVALGAHVSRVGARVVAALSGGAAAK